MRQIKRLQDTCEHGNKIQHCISDIYNDFVINMAQLNETISGKKSFEKMSRSNSDQFKTCSETFSNRYWSIACFHKLFLVDIFRIHVT